LFAAESEERDHRIRGYAQPQGGQRQVGALLGPAFGFAFRETLGSALFAFVSFPHAFEALLVQTGFAQPPGRCLA
jgi:hypothetical protein